MRGIDPCCRLFWRWGLLTLLGFLVLGQRMEAREYSPRILSPHNADAYSMKTFAQFARWRDLKGDAFAWEVFQYLADPRTGLFPLGQEVREGHDTLPEFLTIRDPVKLINVYGYGYCGILGPTMAGVCQDMGLGPARTLIIPGWHHVAAETSYGGRWHYLDLDVRAAFRRPDGSLASMADAQRDGSLWQVPQGPLFFPLDPLDQVRATYAKTPIRHNYSYHFSGHTMDYVLRQGETFTRWWRPQNGRWQHLEAYHQDPFFKNLFEQAPRGPKCKHQGWTIHSHGNGRFVYMPDLTDKSSDLKDGLYDSHNLRSISSGLTLQDRGQGYAIFEIRSPYVIVPLVGKMETTADDREASVVELDATGCMLAVSLDNGITWKDLEADRGKLDLTSLVSGTYGYLLKVSLKGDPEKAVVRSLKITTWVQIAPASLPSLRRGRNQLEYRSGDHYGLQTRVVDIRTNGSDREDFLKYLDEAPKDFDPARTTARAQGPFIVKVQAPPNSKIAWLSAGGNFCTHQQGEAKNTRNSIAYAVDQPRNFKELYRAKVPLDQEHWHYNVDREIRLDQPSKTVYLQYVGDPGVNNLRIYAHCLDDFPRQAGKVVITHTWKEDGMPKSKTITLTRPGPYEITTFADPMDESIEISIPSSADRIR